jgi:hypothetical protein
MSIRKQHIISLLLILLIILARLLPHLPNFTPVAAVALVAAIYLTGRSRWLVPLIGMLLSDLLIGFYHLPIMLSVYGSFVLIYLVGLVIKQRKTITNSLTGVLVSGLIFFGLTNLAVWLFGDWYAHTPTGLYLSYLAAVPFFKATLAGNLFYFAALAGSFELVTILNSYRSRAHSTTKT